MVGELGREEVGAGDGVLRVSGLIAGPSSVEEHCLIISSAIVHTLTCHHHNNESRVTAQHSQE